MTNFKSGFVSIIGRPNSGKSTLLNTIIDAKVAIVTSKAQTTRNQIRGILTTDDYQIVFIDTPGIHNSFNTLGSEMNKSAYNSLDGVDVVLWIVDVTKEIDELDKEIATFLKNSKLKVILVANKVDLIKNHDVVQNRVKEYFNLYQFSTYVAISAKNAGNIDSLLSEIVTNLPVGFKYYDDDTYTLSTERRMVEEIIREKILLKTTEEVPHSVAVIVESFKEDQNNSSLVNIQATIVCERDSQKKIIIGKSGSMIKEIGRLSRLEIVKLIDKKVYLELFVKVEKDWRNKMSLLKEYGYKS